jgi:imidazole glycerol-phosphate synthase subunit HisF
MLRPRIIPCLLVRDKGLVKTVRFAGARYIGDPINAVRIFNEKEVDEIMVLDIDATAERREPDFGMIENLAQECRMPLCFGGGVKTSAQIQKIIQMGVEKVALSSAAVENPGLIGEAAERVGNQSIVVVLDVRARPRERDYEVWIKNGTTPTGRSPLEMARRMEKHGAGEIVINAIDRDGVMGGYDLDLVRQIRGEIGLPLTVLGGAGSLDDIGRLIGEFGAIGAAAGSLFVYKGAYKAVLINYPNRSEKRRLIGDGFGAPGPAPAAEERG